MNLRGRVLLTLAGLLSLALAGAWLVAGGLVLRPLVDRLLADRADVAEHISREVARAEDPYLRAQELGEDLQVSVEVLDRAPPWSAPRRGTSRADGRPRRKAPGARPPRELLIDPSAEVIPVRTASGPRWVAIHFPLQMGSPTRRVAAGMVLIGLAALFAAWGVTRWTLSPLRLASSAMERVAEGDLDHRVPVGPDEAGRIAATFNTMAERVQTLVQGQRELMAAVSHELRSPLARMRLQAELLADEGARPERVEALSRDIEAVDELVEELLESSRLHQGVIALTRSEVDLVDLASEALGAVDLGDRPVVLEVPAGQSAWVDRRRLLRALTNLLSNIARYTPEDAKVLLSAEPRGGGVRIIVADRGPGVSEEALEHLFEPFYRADPNRNRAIGGLGLGLMLVRQIAEAHGGTAGALHRPGGGLAVFLDLPGHRA